MNKSMAINSVLGKCEARELGFTLIHEHLAAGMPGWEFDNSSFDRKRELANVVERLKEIKALGVYANLRPVRAYKSLLDSSPLKNELVDGVDMIIVRELTGGLYYGTPRGIDESGNSAVNTMSYSRLGRRGLLKSPTQ